MCFILVRVILESRHYYIKLFIEIGVSKKKKKERKKLVFHIDYHWRHVLMISFSSDSDNDGSAGKESLCNAGDAENAGWIPRWRRSLGVENAKPLKNCCLKNSTDRGI